MKLTTEDEIQIWTKAMIRMLAAKIPETHATNLADSLIAKLRERLRDNPD